MQTVVLWIFTNEREGIASEVARIAQGFSVIVRDLDADAQVPACRIFSTEAAAVDYARECANV